MNKKDDEFIEVLSEIFNWKNTGYFIVICILLVLFIILLNRIGVI